MARIPRRLAGIGAEDMTDAAEFDAYVGPAREVTVDPVRKLLRLHDGSTAGGNDIVAAGLKALATRSALKALNTVTNTTAILAEAGREGIFNWKTGNYSTQITADTAEGIYLKADAIAATAGAWVRAYDGPADIGWYGAVGDGTTDDTAAVAAAFTAGVPLTGSKKTYAVSGDVSLPANIDLMDAKFKQLTPNNASRRTLYANGVSNVTLRRVTVDRNGNGLGGGLQTAAGIWIEGGSGHKVEDCEVFGNDMGSGLVFNSCTDFTVTRPYAHDITYTSASLPADDQVQGIWFSACQRFTVINPKTKHLGGIVGGSFRRAFARMMPIGLGSSSFAVIGGHLSDGDVGIDLTGSKGNDRFSISNVTVEDVETWGIKVANYNRRGSIIGCNVYRAGSAAFVGSGPTVNVDPDTPNVPADLPRFVTFESCGAWDTGFGNTGRGTSQPAGFLVIPGAASNYQDFPRGYRFINCVAFDNQASVTQYHGFRNETNFGGDPLNEVINCRVRGANATGSGISGFHAPICSVYRTAAFSLTSGNTLEIDFDTERFDKASMHSTVANLNKVFVPRPGFYRVTGKVTFAANGAGTRQAAITVGGSAVGGASVTQPGSSVNDTTCSVDAIVEITDITGGIGLQVFQNSGTALGLLAQPSLSVVEVNVQA